MKATNGILSVPETTETLGGKIIGYLADHPESTTHEIAAGLGLDFGDVQTVVCFLLVDDRVAQPGRRETDHGLRPIYRVIKNDG